MDFGAAGDGITDDTAAVQAALDSLDDTDVWLTHPHRVTAELSITGRTAFSVTDAGGSIIFDCPTASVSGAVAALRVAGCAAFTLDGIALDMVNQGEQQAGIHLSDCQDAAVRACTVDDARWTGISVYDATAGTSTGLTIAGNTVNRCRFGIHSNAADTTVTDNTVDGQWFASDEAGAPWTSASDHWDGIVIGAGSTGVTVIGNTVTDVGQSAIYAGAISDTRIADNIISRPQNWGVDIGPPTLYASGVTVEGNTVTDPASGGVNFHKVNGSTITDNTVTITATTYHGAAIDAPGIALNADCTGNEVAGNAVTLHVGTTDAGIFVNDVEPDSTGNTISGNTVDAPVPYSVNATENTLVI